MGYKKASEVLPSQLVEEIQNYVDGESLYIPRKDNKRRKWGAQTHTCQELENRNQQILKDYQAGTDIRKLARKYYLSEKSIQRIIYSSKSIPPASDGV